MARRPPSPVSPYLLYEDAGAALNFLCRAFGATERMRLSDKDGEISHAELEIAGGTVMLGSPGPDWKGPRSLGAPTSLVHVYLDDVDRHHEVARAAGATITASPQDMPYGDRRYTAEDTEGHLWFFAARQREVPIEELQALMDKA